jgi:uncharacterized membrane protein YeaQ/YmgE (transglycosylase-associated protein family)
MGILWTILIGFIAGVLAKLITPGDNEPSGFILTDPTGLQVTLLMPTGNPSISGNTPSMLFGLVFCC